jgi:hypothetical protein
MSIIYIFLYFFVGWLLSDLGEGEGIEGFIVFLFWPIVIATIIVAGLVSIIYTFIIKEKNNHGVDV